MTVHDWQCVDTMWNVPLTNCQSIISYISFELFSDILTPFVLPSAILWMRGRFNYDYYKKLKCIMLSEWAQLQWELRKIHSALNKGSTSRNYLFPQGQLFFVLVTYMIFTMLSWVYYLNLQYFPFQKVLNKHAATQVSMHLKGILVIIVFTNG